MNLTAKQSLLLDYVKRMHGDQKRKYTQEPYWTHPYSVAEIVSEIRGQHLIEIALCHDLIEDTECTLPDLLRELLSCGYSGTEGLLITSDVWELTDQYTKENYPVLNRSKRKNLEARRLSKASRDAQTVKYADMLHNTASIIEHDHSFAKLYMKEKKFLIESMDRGNTILWCKCLDSIKNYYMINKTVAK